MFKDWERLIEVVEQEKTHVFKIGRVIEMSTWWRKKNPCVQRLGE